MLATNYSLLASLEIEAKWLQISLCQQYFMLQLPQKLALEMEE